MKATRLVHFIKLYEMCVMSDLTDGVLKKTIIIVIIINFFIVSIYNSLNTITDSCRISAKEKFTIM